MYHHFRNDAFYELYNLLNVRETGKREVVLCKPLPQTLYLIYDCVTSKAGGAHQRRGRALNGHHRVRTFIVCEKAFNLKLSEMKPTRAIAVIVGRVSTWSFQVFEFSFVREVSI